MYDCEQFPLNNTDARFFSIEHTKTAKIYQMTICTLYQNGKNIPNDHTLYQKWPQNIPDSCKIDQMAKI
jgi:hypothetical protein